jgi:hypothetical protein
MRCPECGSKRVLVLVHSLRALCGACMYQWCPPDDSELIRVARGAAALSETIAMDLPPDPEAPVVIMDRAEPQEPA